MERRSQGEGGKECEGGKSTEQGKYEYEQEN